MTTRKNVKGLTIAELRRHPEGRTTRQIVEQTGMLYESTRQCIYDLRSEGRVEQIRDCRWNGQKIKTCFLYRLIDEQATATKSKKPVIVDALRKAKKGLTIRQLEKQLQISEQTVRRYINELVMEDAVRIEVDGDGPLIETERFIYKRTA